MARLPTPGGDDEVWGDVLNTYLAVEHNGDGTLKLRTDGTFYAKPASGIPASDLTTNLRNDIDSALKKNTVLFDVKDHGAVGNGVVDDTTAITAAFTAAIAAKGTVFFSPGTYMTTGLTINNAADFTISGSGAGSVVKLIGGGTANVLTLTSCQRFAIHAISLDCNRPNTTLGVDEDKQSGLHLVSCDRFVVHEVRAVSSHMSGIRLGLFPTDTGGCTEGIISSCYVNLGVTADQGIGVWHSKRITVTGCVVEQGGWGGIVLTRSDYCTVVGNVSHDNSYLISGGGGHGVALEGARWSTVSGNMCYNNDVNGVHAAVDPQTSARSVEGCTITGNTCHDNDANGVFLGAATLTTVTGNICDANTQMGVQVDSISTDCVINGNVMSGNGMHGIRIEASQTSASNNTVKNSGAEGIVVRTASAVALNGNHLHANQAAGIDVRGGTHFVIDGNVLEDNAQGIFVRQDGSTLSSDGVISNNVCRSNRNEGLILLSVKHLSISANLLTGNLEGGMDFRGVQYSSINGNSILNNGLPSARRFGIQIKDDGSTFSIANTFTGNNSSDSQGAPSQTRGIEELGSSDRNLYVGNICRNNTDGQISTVGANSVAANNITT